MKMSGRLKQKIKELKAKVGRTQVVAFVMSIAVTTLAFVDSTYFNGTAAMLLAFIALAALFLSFFIFAGVTVMKSFFFIGAEVSLLIFLTQEYCKAVTMPSPNDSAVQTVIILGIMYTVYKFLDSLVKDLEKRFSTLSEISSFWRKAIILCVFVFFMGLCFLALFLLVRPTFMSLCVHKR